MKKETYIYRLFTAAILAGTMPLHAAVEEVTAQYVTNYNFTGDKSVWNIEQNSCNTAQNENCQEFWTGDTSNAWFKMSQTVTDLPEGIYRLTVNAFTRAGNRDISQTAIYATTTEKEYMSPILLRHQDTSYGSMPDAMNTASAAFYSTAGSYWLNTIDYIMVNDGTLTIGARNVGQLNNGGDNGSWTILGNVKLYRLTGSDLRPLLSQVISEAQALASEGNFSGKSDLESAITAAQNLDDEALTSEQIRTLQAAMESYRQTRLADATESTGIDASHLIKNAGFENGAVFRTGTANGNYCEPKGWTMTYGEMHVNNNAGMASPFIEQAGPNIRLTPTEGDWAYSARMRWSNGSHINLTQDITLPAGTYELTADMANLTNDNPPVLTCTTAEGTEVTRLTASSTSLATCHDDKFTLDFPQTVTIQIALTQNGQSNTAMAIDNLRLTYYGTSDINEDAIVNQKIKELNAILEEFVNDYNNSECQQNSGWNNLIDKVNEAELVKDNTSSTEADVQTAIDNLKQAMYMAAIDTENGEATKLIKNPDADGNLNGWTQTLTNIRNEESWKGVTDNYFDGGNWGSASGWTAGIQQELYLPAGYYSLSAIGRCSHDVTLSMHINGLSCTFPAEDNTGGNIWTYASEGSPEAATNNGKGLGWNKRHIGFYLSEDTPCTLEVKATAQAVEHQWYSIDDFKLAYAAEKGLIVCEDNHITASGAIYASELTEAITEEPRYIDLTAVSILIGEPQWPSSMNPNCLIFAPVGMIEKTTNTVCNNICSQLTLADRQPFHSPAGFTAKEATYSRDAYRDGLYETIVLPFDCEKPAGAFVWEEITGEDADHLTTDLTEDETLQAGKAYLMRYTDEPEENGMTQIYQTTNAGIPVFSQPVPDGLFGSTDTYVVESEADGIYMLSAKDGSFRLATAGSYSAPFRACYKSGQDNLQANLHIDNEATAIHEISDQADDHLRIYTLDGRYIGDTDSQGTGLKQLPKGIYIINHKKIIIK